MTEVPQPPSFELKRTHITIESCAYSVSSLYDWRQSSWDVGEIPENTAESKLPT